MLEVIKGICFMILIIISGLAVEHPDVDSIVEKAR
jgi:hypothetical protein